VSKKLRRTKRVGYKPPSTDPNKEKVDAELQDISERAKEIDSSLISLSTDQREELANWVNKRITRANNSIEWTETVKRIKEIRKEYLEGVPRSDRPGNASHDYRSNLSASATDGLRSRLIGVFATDPVVRLEGRNEIGVKNQIVAERWLDYHHDVNIKLGGNRGELITTYVTLEGHCVMYAPYVLEIARDVPKLIQKKVYVKGAEKLYVDLNSSVEINNATAQDYVPASPEQIEVIEIKGTEILKNYPDLECYSLLNYRCPAGSSSDPDTPPAWETILKFYTFNQLSQWADEGKIYKGVLTKLRKWAVTKPTDPDFVDEDTAEAEEEKGAMDSGVNCWTWWGLTQIPGTKYLQKVHLIYHKPSNTIVFSKYNPFIGQPQPFFHPRMIRVPWRFPGIGCMELSRMSEKAINDLTNYVLDETRIFSCIPFKYTRNVTEGQLSSFDFYKGVKVTKMSDFEFHPIPDRRASDLNVSTHIRSNMERRSGIGDLQLGRESDVTGKQPPTARGVISVLREGQVRFGLLNYSMISEITRWASYEMLLFQQLMSRKVIIEAVGEDGKDLFPDGLSRQEILGSFKYVPSTNAQALIRELDIEVNLMLYDRLKDNKLFNADLGAYYAMTDDVIKSTGKKKQWLQKLSIYRKLMNLPDPATRPDVMFSSDEQAMFAEMMQSGIPEDEAKAMIEQLRQIKTTASTEVAVPPQDMQALLGVKQ